jgi:hypothetical protein
MPARKKRGEKKSKPKKTRSSAQLKKAVPPLDNPLLRHQADEILLEGGHASQKRLAELRFKAIEQTRQMANPDSSNTVNKTQRADDG